LKITNVDTYQIGEPKSGSATWAADSILVKLTTSDGIVGFGEAVPTLRVEPVMQSLREVERVYKNADPLNYERNWHEWHKHDFYLPVSFESTTAISAFDIACWDIMGKHFGVPIHQLLGGPMRTQIRVYSNGWYNDCVTPQQFGDRARQFMKMGYSALKFDPFGNYYDYIDEMGLKLAYDRVKAVQDSTDGKIQILIEHHGRFNPNSAIMIAKKLREFDPLFMEEPVHPENFEGLKKYRAETDVRVALGERIITKEQALFVLSNNLADFLQPDITNIGGVTQTRKVVSITEAYGVEIAFHNAFGPIQNAVTIQIDAAISNFLIQESFYDCFQPWKRDLIGDSTKIEDGHTKVSTKPGIGVEVNEKLLEEHVVKGQENFNPDEPVWVVKNTWKS
jgi:L-alanine-DL-glutamate epimerase-like enolase superfamily enzyme